MSWKKQLWSLVGLIMVSAMVLASCAPAEPEVIERVVTEQVEVEKVVTEEVVVQETVVVQEQVVATPEPKELRAGIAFD